MQLEEIYATCRGRLLALAPTLIAIFSIIEGASPRSRLNEAMGIVQTGVSAGIAPGGSLPSYAHGITVRDNDFYRAWDGISRDRDTFNAWIDEHVMTGAQA